MKHPKQSLDVDTIVRKGTMTHAETATYLGIGERLLDNWVQLRGLPVATPSGARGMRLYSRRLVDRWVEDNSHVRIGSKKKKPATKGRKVIGLGSANI